MVDSFVLYDGLGRQIQTQTPAEGGGGDLTDTWYDTQGRVWTTNGDYWAAGANPSANLFVPGAESQIAQQNVTQFDAIGRATKQTLLSFGLERRHTTTAYLGADRVDVVPPAGGTPTSAFTDANGKQTKLVQYLSTGISGTQEATAYSYSASGQMTGMTDPVGNHWSWSFDVLGNQISAADPDTGTTTKTYDVAGNVLTSTDGRGTTLAYSYDALNRKTAEYKDAVGASGTELASWAYDTATLGKGLLASLTRYVGSTAGSPGAQYVNAVNSYDAAGNATKTTVTIPASAPAFAGSYVTTMAYAASGDLTSTTYPAEGGLASEKVKTTYDIGRPSGLSGANNYDVLTYSAIGQPVQHQRFGATSSYTNLGYDLATGQLVESIQSVDDGVNITTPQTSEYTNDPAGNVTKIQTTSDSAATDTQCFGYDQLQELTRAWTPSSGDCSTAPTAAGLGGPAPYWTDYAVDPATGNRTGTTSTTASAVTTASYMYPNATSLHPHAVSSVTTTVGTGTPSTKSYGYNAEGDTTTRPGESLTYDAEGHLSTVTDGANTQSNIYDADGTLLLQNDAGNYTLYMGGTELHKDGSGSVYAVRTYSLAGAPVAERTTTPGTSGSVVRWLGADHHGTVTLEVAVSSGAITVRYEDPYGNPRGTNPGWSSGHTFLNDDQATTSSTVTIGARTYDPAIGKFLTVDAVLTPMNPLANNGYAYSANNPIGFSDPSGNCMLNPDTNRCFLSATSADAASAASAALPKISSYCAQGCSFSSSPNLGKVDKRVDRYGDQTAAQHDCDWSPVDGIRCGKGAGIRDLFHSTFGHLVFPWALGYDDSVEYYGDDAALVQGLRQTANIKGAEETVASQLSSGKADPDQKFPYEAGGPSINNPKFVKDLMTGLDVAHSSQADQVTLAIGSYDLSTHVLSVNAKSRTAVVAFTGSNDISLGSAMATASGMRQFGESITPASGPLSTVTQKFGWTETISY